MQPGWGKEPSGCYPITSGVPKGNNERLQCFAFLSKLLPDDDHHIFPFLELFCDVIMFIMMTLKAREAGFCLLCPVQAHAQKCLTLRGYNLNPQEEPYGVGEILDSPSNCSPL